jgi:hypothetical protein
VSRQSSGPLLGSWAGKKSDSRLKRRSSSLLEARLQDGNRIDCSTGPFSSRRRGLGIFAVAALTRLPDKHVQTLLDPICGIAEGISTPKIDRVYLSQVPQTKSAYNDVSSKKTKVYLYLAFQESHARCPLTRYYRKPKSSTR